MLFAEETHTHTHTQQWLGGGLGVTHRLKQHWHTLTVARWTQHHWAELPALPVSVLAVENNTHTHTLQYSSSACHGPSPCQQTCLHCSSDWISLSRDLISWIYLKRGNPEDLLFPPENPGGFKTASSAMSKRLWWGLDRASHGACESTTNRLNSYKNENGAKILISHVEPQMLSKKRMPLPLIPPATD